MRKRRVVLAVGLAASMWLASAAGAAERPILVVYDFTSTFDGGRMGQWVAEIMRGHALRSGRYIGNPKITVDEVLGEHDFHPTVETPRAELAKFTRDAFGADLFVYGSVSQAGEDDYRVRFRAYRTTKDGKPEKILDETRNCPGKRYVPIAVDEVLNAAAGVKDPPTEWKLLAAELGTWSKEMSARAADDRLDPTRWRQHVLSWEEKLTYRWRNVTARTHRDFASKALLDYTGEVLAAQQELLRELTGGEPAEARAKASGLAELSRCLALSIDDWLDDASAERRWKEGRDLVMNGNFEVGQKTPANWEPLKEHMSWVTDPDGKSGKVVKFDMPEDIAATYGMLLYSQPFAVEEGATYRIRWRFKTMAPAVKLFIKGYDEFPKEFGFEAQEREVWRSRKDPQYGPRVENEYARGEWTEYGHDFVPFVKGPTRPRCLRLMLYAYWPKGVLWWDDIVVRKIKDAPIRPGAGVR